MSHPINLTPSLYHAIISAGQRDDQNESENIDPQSPILKKRSASVQDNRPGKYRQIESDIRNKELQGIDIKTMDINVKSLDQFSDADLASLACAFDRLEREDLAQEVRARRLTVTPEGSDRFAATNDTLTFSQHEFVEEYVHDELVAKDMEQLGLGKHKPMNYATATWKWDERKLDVVDPAEKFHFEYAYDEVLRNHHKLVSQDLVSDERKSLISSQINKDYPFPRKIRLEWKEYAVHVLDLESKQELTVLSYQDFLEEKKIITPRPALTDEQSEAIADYVEDYLETLPNKRAYDPQDIEWNMYAIIAPHSTNEELNLVFPYTEVLRARKALD